MIDYDIVEEWFSKLPEHRKLDIQRRWLDYNKYFDWYYNEDDMYDVISSLESHSDWLTDKEWEEYNNLENG